VEVGIGVMVGEGVGVGVNEGVGLGVREGVGIGLGDSTVNCRFSENSEVLSSSVV
jgi:hypothetical protein